MYSFLYGVNSRCSNVPRLRCFGAPQGISAGCFQGKKHVKGRQKAHQTFPLAVKEPDEHSLSTRRLSSSTKLVAVLLRGSQHRYFGWALFLNTCADGVAIITFGRNATRPCTTEPRPSRHTIPMDLFRRGALPNAVAPGRNGHGNRTYNAQ